MARVQVTKLLTEYIKENKLNDENDKRIIVPDKKLSDLLMFHEHEGEVLTYFNLQKYIKHLFVS